MQVLKRRNLSVRLLCAVITLACLVAATRGWFERLDLSAWDAISLLAAAPAASRNLVIVAIDEHAVHEYGPLPWPPRLMARLIDSIDRLHPRVIGLDFVYTGEGEMPGQPQAESRPGLDELRNAFHRSGRVIAGTFFDLDAAPEDAIPEAPDFQRSQRVRRLRFAGGAPAAVRTLPLIAGTGVHVNAPAVSLAAAGAGHLNLLPASDGIVRRMPLVVRYRDDLYPSFGVRVASAFAGDEDFEVLAGAGRLYGIQIGPRRITTDETGSMLLRFAGPAGTFQRVPAGDVLAAKAAPDALRDALVLVGITAPATGDLWATPNARFMPGVEIHANAINNLLQGSFLVSNWSTRLLTYAIGFTLGFLGIIFLPSLRRLGARGIIIATALAALVLLITGCAVFSTSGYALGIAAPLIQVALMSSGTLALNYGSEERHRKQIEQSFRFYLDADVIKELLEDPQRLRLGGERRELSVLFCDIRGFTSLSEKLPPETIVRMLNGFFTCMSDVVFASQGLVDKFVGDQIMAFWGAPVSHGNHSELACEAALGIRREFPRFRERWTPMLQGMDLNCGIGLNSGPMIVGNIGSERRFSYTVIGDAVNIAARLEGMNKLYGSTILTGPATYENAKDRFWFRQIDQVRVRGRDQAIAVYELLARRGEADPDTAWLEDFEQGLQAFFRQDWEMASSRFAAAHARDPQDSIAAYYLRRIPELLALPSEQRARIMYLR